jgi:hypothetical protein
LWTDGTQAPTNGAIVYYAPTDSCVLGHEWIFSGGGNDVYFVILITATASVDGTQYTYTTEIVNGNMGLSPPITATATFLEASVSTLDGPVYFVPFYC